MSVEMLELANEDIIFKIRKTKDATCDSWNVEIFEPNHWIDMIIDRNQAHLLMLYLQEHLG